MTSLPPPIGAKTEDSRETALSAREDGRVARASQMREQRRRELLDVALSVFAARGYHQTRIADIIEAAGVARGTFYLYFESKNAIFHSLLDELLVRIRGSVSGVVLGPDAQPIDQQLLATVKNVFAAFLNNPALTRIVLRQAIGLDDEVDKKLKEFDERLHVWLVASVEAAKALGWSRAVDASAAAWCVLGSLKEVVWQALETHRSKPAIDRLAEAFVDYNLRGLLAPRAPG